MHHSSTFILLLLAWMICGYPVNGQVFHTFKNPGLPLITNYTPTVYKAHEQVWASLEGPDGRFYFANGDGLLVYNNNDWELIILANKSHVRSMALSPDSTLYVGGDGEIGYVQPDSFGRLQYISLLNKIPPSERVFSRVWTTAVIEGKMHFQTYERLFIWDGISFTIYPTGGKLLRTFLLKGALYGKMVGKGLVYWTGKEFKLAPHGEYFADKTIRVMISFGLHDFLIGTEDGELVLYNHQSLSPFQVEATAQLKRYGLERGCRLDEEHFALSMGSSGLYIFNRQGRLLQQLDDKSGLCSNRILDCHVDRKGNLWLGTQSGISKVALGEPIWLMDRRSGLHGSVDKLEVHEGKLFAGTKEGLFVAQQNQTTYSSFQRVDFFRDRVWAMYPVGPSLLIGHTDGVYEWREGTLTQLNSCSTPASFFSSAIHPGLIWASLDDGCLAIQHVDGKWREVGIKLGLAGSLRGLVEYKKGEVWLGSRAKGMYRLRFHLTTDSLPNLQAAEVKNFAAIHGLPPGDALPLLIDNRLYVFVEQAGQVFSYQDDQEKFILDTSFAARLGSPENQIASWYTQPDGTLWLRTVHFSTGKNTLMQLQKQVNIPYQIQSFAIPSNVTSFGSCLYISSGQVFFGGLEGVLAQDLRQGVDNNSDSIRPLLTRVQWQQHPVAFHKKDTQLPFKQNAVLRFHFAAPFFSATDQISYQTRLAGFEEAWSAWSGDSYKEYTNLWEGTYQFQVRAMDTYGRVSRTTEWQFTVIPPWYRQWWMYSIYLLSLLSIGYGIMHWRSLQLEYKNLQLENTVAERTEQLASQHDQLKAQAEKLRQMDRLKSHFFANISHEFRTPLTLIIGLVRKRQADPKEDNEVILQNAHRLLRLINQLLELSRLEAGNVRLQARRADVIPFLRQIAASFSSLAEQKHIVYTFQHELFIAHEFTISVFLYFDAEKLEQVIINLLANAFKFTPGSGSVDLSVAIVDHAVEIQVLNTGPGIPAGSLPYVFDRFYQADDSGNNGGTGIGLALVKEFIELHHGSVQVSSTPGKETVFTVRLLLGHAHLSSQEIAETTDNKDNLLVLTEHPDSITHTLPAREMLPAEPEPNRPIILVVEDHPDLRKYIIGQLSAEYYIIEAETGQTGWQLAEENLPDLVISDLMMPGMNGLELLKLIKNSDKTSHIPVILLTAKANRESKLEGLATGADDYLIKPFDADEMLIRVANLIRIRQQLREKFRIGAIQEPEQTRLSFQHQVFIEKLYRVLEQHLDNELFGVEQLGEELSMSRSQIHRKVKAITNQSPSDLIRIYRLERAAELIRQDAGNMSEIAWQTGFGSLSTFSRCFHEQYGCSPSEFKKKYTSSTWGA